MKRGDRVDGFVRSKHFERSRNRVGQSARASNKGNESERNRDALVTVPANALHFANEMKNLWPPSGGRFDEEAFGTRVWKL